VDAFADSKDYLYLYEVTRYGSDQQDRASLTYKGEKKVRLRSGGGAIWLISSSWSLPGLYHYYPSEIPWYRPPLLPVEARMQANFLAGAGAYVSPTGELLYYATNHWSVAPGFGGPSIPMAELRHSKVTHSGTCGPQFRSNHLGGPYLIPEASSLELDGTVFHVEPWVQMFQHSNFRGISWMVDWRDRYDDWYDNFSKLDGYSYECREYNWLKPWIKKDGVNDCMSSYRWCGQSGSRLRIFKDKDYQDVKVVKDGTGSVESVSGVGGFSDDATSVMLHWVGQAYRPHAWDLDDDDEFDDAEEAKAMFNAGVGSSTNTVRMRYWHDSDEVTHTDVETVVNVYNVPPSFESLEIDDENPAEGQTVTVSGRWTDPGATECRVTVDWGDGSSDADPDNGGWFSLSHEYGDNGHYPIEVCVADQEDTICETLSATVYNVPPTAVISIDQPNPHFILPVVHTLTYNGSFTDPGWLDTHVSQWDFGDGANDPGTLVEENDPPDATGTTVTEHSYGAPGIYDVTVTVTDDDGDSGVDSIEITVLTATEAIEVLRNYIRALPPDAFVKWPSPWKRVMVRKLGIIQRMIDKGAYRGAIHKLRHDIRAKADCCLGGHPNNDWITDCAAQSDICMMIDDIIAYLTVLDGSASRPEQSPPTPSLSRGGTVRRF